MVWIGDGAAFNVISRRSTPEIVLSRKNHKMANCIIASILCYYWQTLSNSFLIFFSFTKIWSWDESLRRRKMESEDERWARLNKRIERARARHEVTRLVMGTIF